MLAQLLEAFATGNAIAWKSERIGVTLENMGLLMDPTRVGSNRIDRSWLSKMLRRCSNGFLCLHRVLGDVWYRILGTVT